MQDKILKCLGLVTQYNPLTVAPGALLTANDCYIRRENIIEDRRGYKAYSTVSQNISQLMTYMNRVIAHNGTVISYDDGLGTFANYSGNYSAPSGVKMRFVEAFSNLYTTTNAGVKVFSDVAGTAGRLAGAPRALDPSYALSGASGFLATSFQCAYRCVIRRTDGNSNIITGYPSQRLWVVNSAGASRNVDVTVYLPAEAIATDVLQFYRTAQVSGTTSDISGDDMGLVYQYELVAADITAGLVTFTDSVTDALRGATLYTSPSQEGILQANDRPPLCKDMCLFKNNYMLYANTQTKQRLFVTLVGASTLSGKTITLAGTTYNFGASEIITGGGSPQVKVSSTGVAAVDIDETARSLVRVINRYGSNTAVYAYYLTGPTDLPGQILIEEKGLGASAFTLQASDTSISAMFFPAPPVSPSTSSKSTSSNDVKKNYVFYSKAQQPEHVPTLNYLPVGPSNKEILRVVALKNSAIIIKEEGVYRLTGETPQSFSVTSLDLTVFCKAADSVAVLANQVFMLSNQGVVAITEDGVQVISREIEPNITPLLTNTSLLNYTFGCGYESERSYFLSTLTYSSDSVQNQTLVFNIFTRTWVRHTYAFATAIVEQSGDKLYFAKPSAAIVYQERKSFTDQDYADPEASITITAISGDVIDFTIAGATPQVGWTIQQGATEIAISELSSLSGSYRAVLQTDAPDSWVTGAATIFPSVGMEIQWQSWTYQNPDLLKQIFLVGFFADDIPGNNSVTSLDATFSSNFDSELDIVSITPPAGGWGAAWGATPWGGEGDSGGYPTYVPKNKQYATRLRVGFRHKFAKERASIAGVGFSFNVASERIGK